jgi:hypothetical protein
MLAVTDIAVITILVILAANGAYQGFVRSLIGPVALVLSLVVSGFVYLATKSFSLSFLIGIIGPFFFAWVITAGLSKFIHPADVPQLTMISRVMGQLVNLAWGSVVMGFLVAFLAMFPFEQYQLYGVSKDVRQSYSYRVVLPVLSGGRIQPPPAQTNCSLGVCSASPDDLQALADDKEIQEIMNDPRMQALINDPAVQKAAETQNVQALLRNPSIQALTQDPAFLFKVMKVYPKIRAIQNSQQQPPTLTNNDSVVKP